MLSAHGLREEVSRVNEGQWSGSGRAQGRGVTDITAGTENIKSRRIAQKRKKTQASRGRGHENSALAFVSERAKERPRLETLRRAKRSI